jgi:hypothetical protein
MKNILLEIINNDTSCNKSSTRYLSKSHPELWKDILDKTDFLPDTAKPKQRIWHILNDIWEIPKCPVTGLEVKWWENRYLETANRSAKTTLMNKNGKLNNRTSEINEKRRLGNLKAVANGRKYRSKETYTEEQKNKTKKTCLKRYGVDNPFYSSVIIEKIKEKNLEKWGVEWAIQHPLVRKKLSDTLINKGATPLNLRSEFRKYRDEVKRLTEISYNQNKIIINPGNLSRKEFNIDHIYSISDGFKNSIPLEIISHWTNLRMLLAKDNQIKNKRSDKTKEQLFEDYKNSKKN